MCKCAVIVCNGRIRDYEYLAKLVKYADTLICADGGVAHLKKIDVLPNILLGDFDSVSKSNLAFYSSSGVKILQFPPEKDMTDTQLAIEYAIENRFELVILVGALGTRLDHSLANIYLLKKLRENGIDGILVDEHNEIMLIDDTIEINRKSALCLDLLNKRNCTNFLNNSSIPQMLKSPDLERIDDKISLLPFSDKVQGLTTSGLYYPLNNVDIKLGWTVGVSNEFCEDVARVTIKSGQLLVIRSRD